MSSLIPSIFTRFRFLASNTAPNVPHISHEGRHLKAEDALNILLNAIDEDPIASLSVARALGGDIQPSTPSSQQSLFPQASAPSPSPSPSLVPSPSASDYEEKVNAVFAEAQEEEEAPVIEPDGAPIPPVNMQPYIDQALEKVRRLGWCENVEVVDPYMTPMGEAFGRFPHATLLRFRATIDSSRPLDASGAYQKSGAFSASNQSGSYSCFGALLIGEDRPTSTEESQMPDSHGATIKAPIMQLDDGDYIYFFVMNQVETADAIRASAPFKNHYKMTKLEMEEKVKVNAPKKSSLISDPAILAQLLAELQELKGSN